MRIPFSMESVVSTFAQASGGRLGRQMILILAGSRPSPCACGEDDFFGDDVPFSRKAIRNLGDL